MFIRASSMVGRGLRFDGVLYPPQALTALIPKSEVGALSNDSSNIVTLIKEAYEASI